jgi:hypothetical protein
VSAPTKVQDDPKKLSSPRPTRPAPPTPIENALAKRGLARGGAPEGVTKSSTTGAFGESGEEHGYETDESGEVTGTKDTRTR